LGTSPLLQTQYKYLFELIQGLKVKKVKKFSFSLSPPPALPIFYA